MLDFPARVLVVEDDPTVRAMIRATLEQYAHEVFEAENGQVALDLFPDVKPEIVLMDVEMPRVDGIEACRRIRQHADGKLTPILMVTGLEETEAVNRAYQAGATDFINKPINWPVLAQRVRYMIRSARTVRALSVSEARNQTMLEAIPDTICLLDSDGRVFELLGQRNDDNSWPARGAVGQRMQELVPSSVSAEMSDKIRAVLATGRMESLEFKSDSGSVWHEIRMLRYGDRAIMALSSDVTERITAAATVHRLAFYDTLTGLPNRAHFIRHLKRGIRRANENNGKLALVVLDLDSFKRINDNLGHSTGDALLKAAAARLASCVRQTARENSEDAADANNRLARIGGDEFVICAPDVQSEEDAARIAQRAQESLLSPFAYMGREFVLTPSMGIAIFPRDGGDAETLLKNADTAMYQAKSAGRNTHRFFKSAMSRRSMAQLDLELELRRAINSDELDVFFQPKISVADGTVTGVEALVRWFHPQRGPIPPTRFIPLAEETGLIGPMTDWVLQRSGEHARKWHEAGFRNLNVAVNISSRLFTFGDLPSTIRSTLCACEMPAENLEIEITESLFLRDVDHVRNTLAELREMGISVAVDDFGTGYSSLTYLKRLHVDTLKIDRMFVKDVVSDPEDRSICAAIVAMGHSMGLKVIAEGVETQAHMDEITKLGADEVQGFLYSKAIPGDRIPGFITAFGRRSLASLAEDATAERRSAAR